METPKTTRFAGGLLGAAALLFLRRFPPGAVSFYPSCPFHTLTGWDCPGCGATRALAALLHGQLHRAWDANALFTALLPVAVAYLLIPAVRPLLSHRASVTGLLVLAVGFAVWRNLPA